MTSLLIIGIGGLAKEIEMIARLQNKKYNLWKDIFYISDKSEDINKKIGHSLVLGDDNWVFNSNDTDGVNTDWKMLKEFEFVIGSGVPEIKSKIIKKYSLKISSFINYCPNIIHPEMILDSNITLEYGNVIAGGCQFTTDIKIGSFNLFNLNMTVGHDADIGNYNVFNPSVNISGGVKLGNRNLIGTGAQILENLILHNDITVGAGAVVTKNIKEDNITVVGIPAKQLNVVSCRL